MTHSNLSQQETIQQDPMLGAIVHWIADKAGVPSKDISPSSEITGGEMLDSLQLMDLVFHLEETQDVQIPLEWLTPENFSTPQTVVDMVKRAQS